MPCTCGSMIMFRPLLVREHAQHGAQVGVLEVEVDRVPVYCLLAAVRALSRRRLAGLRRGGGCGAGGCGGGMRARGGCAGRPAAARGAGGRGACARRAARCRTAP
mgnify:CR=1 FL=1